MIYIIDRVIGLLVLRLPLRGSQKLQKNYMTLEAEMKKNERENVGEGEAPLPTPKRWNITTDRSDKKRNT